MSALVEQINAALWVGVCLFAFWKGDQSERLGAAFLLIAWLASVAVWSNASMLQPEYFVFAIDAVAVLALGLLAWKSERSWPIWATAFQAIQTTTHIAYALDLQIGAYAYVAAQWVAAKGVIGALAVGTFIVWREREALKGPI